MTKKTKQVMDEYWMDAARNFWCMVDDIKSLVFDASSPHYKSPAHLKILKDSALAMSKILECESGQTRIN